VSPIETPKKKLTKGKTIDGELIDMEEFPNIPNEELNYRKIKIKVKGLNRIYTYFSAPVVKFLNHFVSVYIFIQIRVFFVFFRRLIFPFQDILHGIFANLRWIFAF